MLVRALYSLLMWLLQPVVRAKLRRRAVQEPAYGQHVEERFGVYPALVTPLAEGQYFVWVHAVSLGETRAAAELITALRTALPGMRLLLTHGTSTGRVQGQTLLQAGDVQVWQPWDTPAAAKRFLDHFKPLVGLLVETEVWPNMVAACQARHVPLCLVNARMSEKSLKQSLRLAWLARPAYAGLRAVWAQAAPDAARLAALGAPVQGVLGNFKFDAVPDAAQLAQGQAWRRAQVQPVLVFANTRDGEESLFLQVLKRNRPVAPVVNDSVATKHIANQKVQWMLVPRHPQRFDAIAALCEAEGFTVSRRSQWTDGPEPADIWLGDSMGEMALYYALSDVALLGGSFAPLGGHNLIEATACGCPVVMGPHTFNFAQAAELAVEAGAAFARPDMARAVAKALALVQSTPDLHQAQAAGRALGQEHGGAAQRTALAVQQLLG
ncbi:3-deoxy-D-manno-octulosonic acid transferase [Rhodoferax sp. AJA081-3]|nr:3-deoxy-D-manno-octulosonic acid transferase [Rhodoferax sp. AJA081-3]